MSEDAARGSHDAAAAPGSGDGHSTPHLPPPSLAPINVALALAVIFVGFLKEIRGALGPWMWVVGLVWLAVSCAVWARAARTEYLDLPEDALR